MVIIPDQPCSIQSLARGHSGKPDSPQLAMLRLDTLHPVISGNKWYKLKHNLAQAVAQGYQSVLSFGGAYSNHLIATAAAAAQAGLKSTGIVRGLHARQTGTPTLAACAGYGMELEFVSREDYAKKEDPAWLAVLAHRFGNPFTIPEGGANQWGRTGVAEIARQIPGGYTHIAVSVGSGTTMAGLRNTLPAEVNVWGYAPMKQGRYLEAELKQYLSPGQDVHFRVFDDWHFGGFGKWTDELIDFMNVFYSNHQIPLDIIYTGKMMYGLHQQIKAGVFSANDRILCIHTGGLQGNSSLKTKLLY